jgi:VanZ family protein
VPACLDPARIIVDETGMTSILAFLTPRRALAVTLLIAAIIAVLTLMPPGAAALDVPGGDKLHHLLAFAALAFPVALSQPRHVPAALIAIMLFGGIIELVQPRFGRSAELTDFLADAAGALIGSATGLGLRRMLLRPSGQPRGEHGGR